MSFLGNSSSGQREVYPVQRGARLGEFVHSAVVPELCLPGTGHSRSGDRRGDPWAGYCLLMSNCFRDEVPVCSWKWASTLGGGPEEIDPIVPHHLFVSSASLCSIQGLRTEKESYCSCWAFALPTMPRVAKRRWSCYCVGDWNFMTLSGTSSSLDFEKQNLRGISMKG